MLQQVYFNLRYRKGKNAQNYRSSSHGIHTHNFKDSTKPLWKINNRRRKRKRDLLKEVGDVLANTGKFPSYKRSSPPPPILLNEFDHMKY
jgi:hypothetical protein